MGKLSILAIRTFIVSAAWVVERAASAPLRTTTLRKNSLRVELGSLNEIGWARISIPEQRIEVCFFSPHPSLSPRRGYPSRHLRLIEAGRHVPTQDGILPLPKGEGKGEGERSIYLHRRNVTETEFGAPAQTAVILHTLRVSSRPTFGAGRFRGPWRP